MSIKPCSDLFKHFLTKSHLFGSKRFLGQQTHYDILGLPRNCTTKDIKTAFITLSKRYHPDKNSRTSSHKHYVRVVEAYSILSKPDSRYSYDWQLSQGGIRNPGDYRTPPRARRSHRGYGYDDPSFWTNRDRSRDHFYAHQSYYGIPGLTRVSNGIVAVLCIFITAVGVTLQFFAIRHSMTLKREALKQMSVENEEILAKIQDDAVRNGNQRQIERLEQRFRQNPHYTPRNQNNEASS